MNTRSTTRQVEVKGKDEAKRWNQTATKEMLAQQDLSIFDEKALEWLGMNAGRFKKDRTRFNKELNDRRFTLSQKKKYMTSLDEGYDGEAVVDTSGTGVNAYSQGTVSHAADSNQSREDLERQLAVLQAQIKLLLEKNGIADPGVMRDSLPREQASVPVDQVHVPGGTRITSVNQSDVIEIDSEPNNRRVADKVKYVSNGIKSPTYDKPESSEETRIFIKQYKIYKEQVETVRRMGSPIPLTSAYDCMSEHVKKLLMVEKNDTLEVLDDDALLKYLESTRVLTTKINLDLSKESPIKLELGTGVPITTVSKWILRIKSDLEKRGANYLFDSTDRNEKLQLGQFLLRGIDPPALLQQVRNQLVGRMDQLDWHMVREALVQAITNGESYLNRAKVSRDTGEYRRSNYRDDNRRHSYQGSNKRYDYQDGNRDYDYKDDYRHYKKQRRDGYSPKKQYKKSLMDIDVAHPIAGIDVSIDPTDTKGKLLCAVCKGPHRVRECNKATEEQKTWYHAFVRKKFKEFDDKQKNTQGLKYNRHSTGNVSYAALSGWKA